MNSSMDALEPDLRAGLQELGLALSAAQISQLLRYAALIGKWNQVYNLTALRAHESILTHHLLDCLAIMPALQAWAQQAVLQSSAPSILDVGSGAGLPGLVIAICQPEWQVHTIDTVAKKAAFMQQVAASLQLKQVKVHHARVEELAQQSPQRYDLITSRAFSSLRDFVSWTDQLRTPLGGWAAMKGKLPTAEELSELAQLPQAVHMKQLDTISVPQLDAQRCLVWLQSLHG